MLRGEGRSAQPLIEPDDELLVQRKREEEGGSRKEEEEGEEGKVGESAKGREERTGTGHDESL